MLVSTSAGLGGGDQSFLCSEFYGQLTHLPVEDNVLQKVLCRSKSFDEDLAKARILDFNGKKPWTDGSIPTGRYSKLASMWKQTRCQAMLYYGIPGPASCHKMFMHRKLLLEKKKKRLLTTMMVFGQRRYAEQALESIKLLGQNWFPGQDSGSFLLLLDPGLPPHLSRGICNEASKASSSVFVIPLDLRDLPTQTSCVCNGRAKCTAKVNGGHYNINDCHMGFLRVRLWHQSIFLRSFHFLANIDTDLYVIKNLASSLFRKLEETNLVLASRGWQILGQDRECSVGLYEYARSNSGYHNETIPAGGAISGNFFILSTSALHQIPVKQGLALLVHAEGLYTHRWTDQLILPLVLSTAFPAEQIGHLPILEDISNHKSESLGRKHRGG